MIVLTGANCEKHSCGRFGLPNKILKLIGNFNSNTLFRKVIYSVLDREEFGKFQNRPS